MVFQVLSHNTVSLRESWRVSASRRVIWLSFFCLLFEFSLFVSFITFVVLDVNVVNWDHRIGHKFIKFLDGASTAGEPRMKMKIQEQRSWWLTHHRLCNALWVTNGGSVMKLTVVAPVWHKGKDSSNRYLVSNCTKL